MYEVKSQVSALQNWEGNELKILSHMRFNLIIQLEVQGGVLPSSLASDRYDSVTHFAVCVRLHLSNIEITSDGHVVWVNGVSKIIKYQRVPPKWT